MKRTLLDKVVGFISPQAEVRRIKAKAMRDYYIRSYDAAQTFRTDDWSSVAKNSSNKEIALAQATIRDKARDAIRNNPYARHGLEVIVANVVGHGIVPNIKGLTPEQTTEVREAWKIWGETPLCDVEGRLDYYGLQSAVMRSTFEAGEVLSKKVIAKDPQLFITSKGKKSITTSQKIQVLESDFIDSKKEDDKTILGVEVDSFGKSTGYWIFEKHPGDGKDSPSKKIPSSEIIHIFNSTRPGQRRGISEFHNVIRILEDLKNFQDATLIRQKIAACYTAFITTSGEDTVTSAADVKRRREQDASLEPGITRWLNPGEQITFANPPGVENYAEYCRQTLRSVAAGLGITYEALANDYSQVNFSSGRMGKMEMNKAVDVWRWNVIIPQFCEPTFKWFLEWCELSMNIKTEGVTVEWTPPAREFIDPGSEIEAIKKSIRSGLKTLPEAIREQGYDPETFFLEVQKSNEMMDQLGLAFDSDARKMSAVGFAQAGDSFDKLLGNEPTGDKISEENSENADSEGSSEEPA